MKLWVTQNSSSDHPKGEQRRGAHVHTCLHFYRNSYTVCVRLMSEAQFENVEQKTK